MDARPLRWKNKRKKSLYSEEAEVGFIFKKLPREDDSKVSKQTKPKKAVSPLAGAMGKDAEEPFDEDIGKAAVEKGVELQRFIAQLRKELLAAGIEGSEHELDRALGLLAEDLREKYSEYLEAPDDDGDDGESSQLEQELQENISQLKTTIEMYRRELAEWEEVIEKEKVETKQFIKDMEEERVVDFLNLRPENVDALRTYLTPEQTRLAQQGSGVDSTFTAEWTKQLENITSTLDREMNRIQSYCQRVAEQITAEYRDLEHPAVEETPRTLFRALKNHL